MALRSRIVQRRELGSIRVTVELILIVVESELNEGVTLKLKEAGVERQEAGGGRRRKIEGLTEILHQYIDTKKGG
jgi:hypothetical protein